MFSHTSIYALPHAERGFVSFGSGLLSGGGGSRELLFAKSLVWCAKVSSVWSLAVYQLQKVHRRTNKNKQVFHKEIYDFSKKVFSLHMDIKEVAKDCLQDLKADWYGIQKAKEHGYCPDKVRDVNDYVFKEKD